MLNVYFILDGDHIQNVNFKEITEKEITWSFEGGTSALQDKLSSWMHQYLEGRQPLVDLPLFLDDLPPFTKRVLTELQKVPYGKTLTYQQLAIQTGNPRAARAVGNACNRNPFALLIPCHRVVSQSDIGGFAFPLIIKECLLSFEQSRGQARPISSLGSNF